MDDWFWPVGWVIFVLLLMPLARWIDAPERPWKQHHHN
jgi:hypothetical protein